MAVAITTGVAHWDRLALRYEAIKELAETTTKLQNAIDIAINGTTEEKIAVLNSLQSHANRVVFLEKQIYKFKIGEKVIRLNGNRSVGTIVARELNGDSSIYTVQNEETGFPVSCHELELASR